MQPNIAASKAGALSHGSNFLDRLTTESIGYTRTFHWASRVSKLLPKNDVVAGLGIEAFLFGSANYKKYPTDIDLLLIYDPRVIAIDKSIDLRRRLRAAIKKEIGLPVDILLLSKREAKETKFLSRVRAISLVFLPELR